MSPTFVAPWSASGHALKLSPWAVLGCCASLDGLYKAMVLRPPAPSKRGSPRRSTGGGRRPSTTSTGTPGSGTEGRRSASSSPALSVSGRRVVRRRPAPATVPQGPTQQGPAPQEEAPTAGKITAASLAETIDEVATSVKPLEVGSFVRVRELQQASRNFGAVDLMTWQQLGQEPTAAHPEAPVVEEVERTTSMRTETDEQKVAVKRMPLDWVGSTPKDFDDKHQDATEKPWLDLGILKRLNDAKFPYVSRLYGVFCDAKELYVVTSYASQGDLFAWTFDAPGQGRQREAWLRPLAQRLFDAVRRLHDLGIAHRDLSLENVLLEQDGLGEYTIKVIDYAMATMERPCTGAVGKKSYQPPELHSRKAYDPFLLDSFALGVMLFTLAMKDYPWATTQPEHCKLFGYVSTYGFPAYLAAKKLRKGGGLTIAESFSFGFLEFLEGLLELRPDRRTDLGEVCYSRRCGRSSHRSVWQSAWLTGADLEDTGFEIPFAGCV